MWYWKNNGPRPPWGPEEIMMALDRLISAYGWYFIIKWTIISTLLAVLGILEMIR